MLHLRLQYSDTSRGEWMSSMVHAAASLSRLEKLLLDCSEGIGCEWDRVQGTPLLSSIFRHAQRLRVLQVYCHTFSIEAPLQSLQHLLLTLGSGDATVDLSALALAPNLVTMQITNLCLASGVRTTPEHLDFRPLSRLKAVCLSFIAPTQLSLPQGCWLAVVVDKLELARARVWDTVRSHIRCFTIRSSRRLTAMTDLPAVLLREPPILQVSLTFSSFGTAVSPLQLSRALAQATSLALVSKRGMYLLVPNEASWRHLLVTAPKQLQWEWLSADGSIVPWLPQRLPFETLSIKYGSLLGTGVLELYWECSRQDTQYQSGRGEQTQICMSTPGSKYHRFHQWECCCGACGDCLWEYWRESVWPLHSGARTA